jgi:hypothetical protein
MVYLRDGPTNECSPNCKVCSSDGVNPLTFQSDTWSVRGDDVRSVRQKFSKHWRYITLLACRLTCSVDRSFFLYTELDVIAALQQQSPIHHARFPVCDIACGRHERVSVSGQEMFQLRRSSVNYQLSHLPIGSERKRLDVLSNVQMSYQLVATKCVILRR